MAQSPKSPLQAIQAAADQKLAAELRSLSAKIDYLIDVSSYINSDDDFTVAELPARQRSPVAVRAHAQEEEAMKTAIAGINSGTGHLVDVMKERLVACLYDAWSEAVNRKTGADFDSLDTWKEFGAAIDPALGSIGKAVELKGKFKEIFDDVALSVDKADQYIVIESVIADPGNIHAILSQAFAARRTDVTGMNEGSWGRDNAERHNKIINTALAIAAYEA